MSLVTRCPKCATAFRVLPAQLSADGGRVRCGKCSGVFDGIAGLLGEHSSSFSPEPSPQLGLFDPGRQPRVRVRQDDQPLPQFLAKPVRRGRRWPWVVLSLFAALALLGQAAYRFRAEIAALVPAGRPSLEAACGVLGCRIALPRQIKLLSIDAYEVRADPAHDGVVVLTAVIRNRAPFAQAYPALQFALTDDTSRSFVSRTLSPRDYLAPDRAAALISSGIDANGEASVTVYFDASRVRATGYRLELFYPS